MRSGQAEQVKVRMEIRMETIVDKNPVLLPYYVVKFTTRSELYKYKRFRLLQ